MAMFTAKLKSQKKTPTLKKIEHRLFVFCGAGCFSLFCTMGNSRLVHGAKTRRLHLELGIKRKKKQRKIARGIFRSLAPLLGTAGSLSDCGIKPTIAELNSSRGANSLRPSLDCTCFRLDQLLASAS